MAQCRNWILVLICCEVLVDEFEVKLVGDARDQRRDNYFCELVAEALSFAETERNEGHWVPWLALGRLEILALWVESLGQELFGAVPLVRIAVRQEWRRVKCGTFFEVEVAEFAVSKNLVLACKRSWWIEPEALIDDLVQERKMI